MNIVGVIVITVVVVALAGPLPTIINGVLVLILSGLILAHATGISGVITTLTQSKPTTTS